MTGRASEHECDNGWADQEAARPCPTCRPWHYSCTTCGATVRSCANTVGKCCPSCPHTPPALKRRRSRRKAAA